MFSDEEDLTSRKVHKFYIKKTHLFLLEILTPIHKNSTTVLMHTVEQFQGMFVINLLCAA